MVAEKKTTKKNVVSEENVVTPVVSNIVNQSECGCSSNDKCCSTLEETNRYGHFQHKHFFLTLIAVAIVSSMFGFICGVMAGNFGNGYGDHRYHNGYMNGYSFQGIGNGMMFQDNTDGTSRTWVMPGSSYLSQMDGTTATSRP